VSRYVLVSALGALRANAKSKTFYTRLKGQLDEAVQKLGFPYCELLRPPMLKRPNTGRLGEKIGLIVIKGLNIIGLLKSWKPMPVSILLKIMQQAVKFEGNFAIWESKEMWGQI
jgi:oxidoreductase